MARPAKSPASRAADVRAAADVLSAALAAVAAAESNGSDPIAVQRAWEAVELVGATIHRQARILAGKTRGG